MSKFAMSIRLNDLTRKQLDALTERFDATQASIVSTAIDRMYIQEIEPMKRRYPIGHKFFSYLDRGDDNPQSREEVTVTGYFKDKIQTGGNESGVVVQADDGYETEISYAYLQEDGSGH